MRRIVVMVFLGLVVLAASVAADPLTTPLTKTVTQYAVQSITFDLMSSDVRIVVQLQDASGALIDTKSASTTFTALGLTVPQQATLKKWATDYLKANGIIN